MANTVGARYDAPDNEVTTTRVYIDKKFWLKTMSEVRPDGTATVYNYEIDGPTLAESTVLTTTTVTGNVKENDAAKGRAVRDVEDENDTSSAIVIDNGIRNTVI